MATVYSEVTPRLRGYNRDTTPGWLRRKEAAAKSLSHTTLNCYNAIKNYAWVATVPLGKRRPRLDRYSSFTCRSRSEDWRKTGNTAQLLRALRAIQYLQTKRTPQVIGVVTGSLVTVSPADPLSGSLPPVTLPAFHSPFPVCSVVLLLCLSCFLSVLWYFVVVAGAQCVGVCEVCFRVVFLCGQVVFRKCCWFGDNCQ